MKIKRIDLTALLEYLDKENVEIVDMELDDAKISSRINVSFFDADGRQCTVSLYSDSFGTAPQLTKSMPLNSRLKKSPQSKP